MIDEQKIWKLIENLNWKLDHNYERISLELSVLSKDDFNKLEEFVSEKVSKLNKTYQDAWLGRDGGPGFDVSDDGWSDLIYDVVGRGENFYNSITADKLREMASEYDYEESFCYCFQRSINEEKYKIMNDYNEELYITQIDGMVDEIEKLIQSLPEDSYLRTMAASRFIFESVLWGTRNIYEGVGLIEKAKMEFIDTCENSDSVCDDCRAEEENVVASKYTC